MEVVVVEVETQELEVLAEMGLLEAEVVLVKMTKLAVLRVEEVMALEVWEEQL